MSGGAGCCGAENRCYWIANVGGYYLFENGLPVVNFDILIYSTVLIAI